MDARVHGKPPSSLPTEHAQRASGLSVEESTTSRAQNGVSLPTRAEFASGCGVLTYFSKIPHPLAADTDAFNQI